jgi:hypothetical protein
MVTSEEEHLIEVIGHRIDWYSTALLRLRTDEQDPQDEYQIGSGTFVSVEGKCGILTAHHVAKELNGHCSLGLILKHDVHRYAINHDHFTIDHIAVPQEQSHEPDLAFIGLYPPDTGTIKANKLFYEMSTMRKHVLNDMISIERGTWFVWGVPGERTSSEPSEKGFENIVALNSLCAATRATGENQAGEHDYIDIEVEYGKSFDVPASFGGFSGGGVWQVFLQKSETGNIVPKEYILAGVAFYQTEIKNQIRYLHCHGRRSIYDYAYRKITKR